MTRKKKKDVEDLIIESIFKYVEKLEKKYKVRIQYNIDFIDKA